MSYLLVSKSINVFHEEPAYDPMLDPYLQEMPMDDIPSLPPSPSESPRPETFPETPPECNVKSISEEGKRLRSLLRIRKMLRSRTEIEIRNEIRKYTGALSMPVHDHLNFKQLKNIRN
jgi:hypothetical protein